MTKLARILKFLLIFRRLSNWALLKIFFAHDVIARSDPLARRFHLFRIEHQWWAVTDQFDNETIRRFSKRICQVLERANFLPVNFIDNLPAIRREISVDRVGKNICQDNHVRMLEINLVKDEIIEEMSNAQIGWLISFK